MGGAVLSSKADAESACSTHPDEYSDGLLKLRTSVEYVMASDQAYAQGRMCRKYEHVHRIDCLFY